MQLRHSILLFKSIALLIAIVVCVVSWFLYHEITNGIKLERGFSELESAVSRIISQKERYITERKKDVALGMEPLYFNFQDKFNQLLVLIIDDPIHVEQLAKVDEKVKEFTRTFSQFEQSQAKLGYSENDGVYGEFRYHAYQLQSFASKASLTNLEILVLELRRAEKDYLLRHKPHYLTLHQQYFEKAMYLVKKAQPDRAAMNSQYLVKYQHGFLEYVALMQQQGLTHRQGLRAELNQNIEEIKTQRKILSEALLNSRHNKELSLIFYDLLAMALISVFCLILLSYLNNRVSIYILKVKQTLQQAIDSDDFSIRANLQGNDEISQISHHLDELFSYVETLITRLNAAKAQLVEESKIASLSNIFSGFAHELKKPLSVAITSQFHLTEQVKELKEVLESGEIQKKAMQNLTYRVESELFLLEDNLQQTVSLIDNFKKETVHQHYDDMDDFNLKTLVMGIFDCYQSELAPAYYILECEIPDNLVLTSYPAVFSQIVSYCINNSIKHGKIENKRLNIVVSAMVVNDFVHFYFKDDGNGIDKDLVDNIFDPCMTTKHCDGGTGLGLSIVYNLVTQKLKGEVKMQSPAHGGACLHIILENTAYRYDKDETFRSNNG